MPPEYLIYATIASVLISAVLKRPLVRGANLLVLYWWAMMVIGPWVALWSVGFFATSPEHIAEALLLYVVGLLAFVVAFATARTAPTRPLRVQFADLKGPRLTLTAPAVALIVGGIGLASTWWATGLIPLLGDDVRHAKYFVYQSDAYLQLRPIYTFSLFLVSANLTFLLAMAAERSPSATHLLLMGLAIVLLTLTAKRAHLLFPFLYVGLATSLRRRSIRQFVFLLLVLGSAASILGTVGSQSLAITVSEVFIHSFFVGVRELSVLLDVFSGDLLWGSTYLAGLLSFIPTEYFALKEQYLYGRYLRILVGQDADLAGGMRASFLGEAYINFGWLGVIANAYLFGLITYAIDARLLNSKLVQKGGIAGAAFYFLVVHKGMIAYFEDGTNVVLHLLFPALIYSAILRAALR